jgi:predicted ABC-type ATPase
MFRQSGADYFNPDEVTGRILAANPGVTTAEANSAAWHEGKRLLERAISERLDFAFETTLGGRTMAALLEKALVARTEVRIWFLGLSSPEVHIARVRSRVALGGHDIPEDKIRERYDQSRVNLIELMPKITELKVYDNSIEADPRAGRAPQPMLLLHLAARGERPAAFERRRILASPRSNAPGILTRRALPKPGALLLPGALGATPDFHHGLLAERKILEIVDLAMTPDWAKPLVAAAIRFSR